MRRTARVACWWLLVTSVVVLWAGSAGAHGGGVDEGLQCVSQMGAYRVHMDIFREGRSYCQRVPSPGSLRLVFDLMTPNLRRLPLRLRVDQIRGDTRQTVVQTEPQTYSSGVATLDVSLEEQGRYVALVEVLQGGEGTGPAVEIPIVVGKASLFGMGLGPETLMMLAPIPFMGLTAFGLWLVHRLLRARA